MDSTRDCTWPEVRERAHYVAWLAAALLTSVLVGLTVDLLAVRLTGGNVGDEIVPLLYACAIVPPYVYAWRKHGETCCRFLKLEHSLDEALRDQGPGGTARFDQVRELIERIEAARGMERQAIRNEAKAWLTAHAEELTRDERDYVAEHLGYLHRR